MAERSPERASRKLKGADSARCGENSMSAGGVTISDLTSEGQGMRLGARLRSGRRRPSRPGPSARAIRRMDRARLRGRDELSEQKPLRARRLAPPLAGDARGPRGRHVLQARGGNTPRATDGAKSRATPTAGITTSS